MNVKSDNINDNAAAAASGQKKNLDKKRGTRGNKQKRLEKKLQKREEKKEALQKEEKGKEKQGKKKEEDPDRYKVLQVHGEAKPR